MNSLEIPRALFEEIATKFGKGERREVIVEGVTYTLVELHEKVGFRGSIGFFQGKSNKNFSSFKLWDDIPIFQVDISCVLTIKSYYDKVWNGRYQELIAVCRTRFAHRISSSGYDVRGPVLRFLTSLLARAAELASKKESPVPV